MRSSEIMASSPAGHTYAFRDRPLEEALAELECIGFDAVELWLGHAASADAALEALSGRRLKVAAVSAGGFYAADDRPQVAFELATRLGAGVVVGCVAPGLLPWLVPQIPAGVTLCVENHWYQVVSLPGEVAALMRPQARVAACLDTGHGLMAGVPPERYLQALGPAVRHVHLKDAAKPGLSRRMLGRRVRRRFLSPPAQIFPGSGDLDVPGIRRALVKAGFRGTVSLEYEGPDAAAGLTALLELWQDDAQLV